MLYNDLSLFEGLFIGKMVNKMKESILFLAMYDCVFGFRELFVEFCV